MNSAGSAMQENERYLDSIQGKIDKFTNSLQTFWMNVISSNWVKDIVSAGTGILDLLNNITSAIDNVAEGFGSLGIIVPAIIAKIGTKTFMKNNNINDLSGLFSFGKDKLFNITGLTKFFDTFKNRYNEVINLSSKTKGIDILAEFANYDDAIGQLDILKDLLKIKDENTTVSKAFVKSILEEHAAELGLNAETIQAILNSELFAASQTGAAVGTDILTAAQTRLIAVLKGVKAAFLGLLAAHPVLTILAGIAAAIGLVVAAYNKWGPTHKNFVKQLDEESQKLDEIKSKLKDLNSELETNKKRIEELENKGPLSYTEDEELKKLKETNAELERQIKLEEAREQRALQKQLNAGINAAKTDKNFQDIYQNGNSVQNIPSTYAASYNASTQNNTGTKYASTYAAVSNDASIIKENLGNKYEQNLNKLEEAKQELDKANEELNNAIESGMANNSEEFKNLEKNVENAQKKVDDCNTTLDNLNKNFTETYGDIGYQEILDSDSEALKQLKEQWNEFYRQQQEYINKQGLLNGTLSKADVFTNMFGANASEDAKKAKEEIEKILNEDEGLIALKAQLQIDSTDLAGARKDLQDIKKEAEDAGVDLSKTLYGNIDLDNRGIIEWNEDNLNKYKDILESYGMTIEEMKNSYSTVLGSWDTFGENRDIKIAFSPMLQTENGAELLDGDTVNNYINSLINKAKESGEEPTYEILMDLDAKGLEINGKKIKGLLADVGETAEQTAGAMHFGGKDGAIADATKQVEKMQSVYDKTLSTIGDKLQGLINKHPLLANSLETLGIPIKDLAGWLTQTGEFAEQVTEKIATTITSLDKITSSIDAYKSALEVANDITFDGQGISEDYYNSLKEYLGDVTAGEEDFSDAIDTTNGYIVKNTTLLKKLISQKKAEAKATVNAVKSQGQLQYVKLTKQLQQEVAQLAKQYKANNAVTLSTVQNVSALRSQIEALKLTIKQYALLELQLSDATNAYDKFQKAKDFDAQLTYGDSLVEGIKALNDGFATGQVGTETFQAAVDMIVPPEAYESIDNYEDRLIAIHDYVDKNPLFADWFTVDEDGNFGIEFKNMAAFVQDMQEMGVFTGDDITGFNFAEDIFTDDGVSAIDKIVAKTKEWNNGVGVTKETIVAMMTELSKYDARWGDLLTELTSTPLDREINNATDALSQAVTKQEEFIRSGGDLNSEEYQQLVANVNNASSALEQATQKAQQNAQTTVQCETMYDAMTGKIKLTQGAADALAQSLGLIDEQNPTITIEDGKVVLTQAQLDKLNQTKASLSETSTMDIQGNFDQITKDLAALEQYKKDLENDPNATIKINGVEIKGAEEAQAKIDALTAEREEISIKYNITKTSDDSQTVLERLDEISVNGYTIPVKADATEAHKTVDEVDADNPKDKTTTIEADDQATPVVDDYINKLDEIPDTVTTTIVTNKKTNYSWSFRKSDEEPEHALGTAHAIGNINSDGSLQKEEQNAIVGEIGPELVVDAKKGVYYTVGDNGTEMVNLPKGAIIYNHKQTEELLKNGKINSRGKYTGGLSFANGNAYASYNHGLFGGYLSDDPVFKDTSKKWVEANQNWVNDFANAADGIVDAADSISDASDSMSDAADEFEDTINWIEVLFARIDNLLSEHEAYLATVVDSTGGLSEKDSIYSAMFDKMFNKMSYSIEAANYYQDLADSILAGMDEVIASKVRNGTILIEKITDEALKENIDKALDYLDQSSQYRQQYFSTVEEIANKAVERQEEAAKAYENEIGLVEHLNNTLEARNNLEETRNSFANEAYYKAQIEANNIMLKQKKEERDALQAILDQELALNHIKVGDQQWFDMQNAIYDCDDALIDFEASIEDLQNAINDLYWDKFDELINRFGYLEDELSNVIQLLSHDPDGLVMEELRDLTTTNWATGSGLASLGLYAQQMEEAQYVANQYAEQIKELKKQYGENRYNETEYLNKLNELISAQYENIEKYYDAKDAIIELNEARVDAIKTGIQEEIDKYDELISKKKELLNREQD